MEWEVEDGIFDDLVIMVYFLEIMQSCFFDEVVSFDPVDWIEEGYFQSKNVNGGSLKDKLVLWFYACFMSIEKGQELSVWWLAFFLFLFLLFSIFLTVFIFFCLLCFDVVLGCLGQHSEVPHLFFIPVDGYRNVLLS